MGICKNCGAGICLSCAEEGFPVLCPVCRVDAANKNITRLRQNNRIMLYVGLFFALLAGGLSYIIFLNAKNGLWFLLNLSTLALAAIFVLLFLKNKKKKQKENENIKKASDLKSLEISAELPLKKEDLREIIDKAVEEIISKMPKSVGLPKSATHASPIEAVASDLQGSPQKTESKPKTLPKNNPFATEPKTKEKESVTQEHLTKSKNAKKVWTCDCGKENLTSKLFCLECGIKRTKEMLANAKEI